MKILKIFGIVAGIHAFALLVIFANPGCSSTTKQPAPLAEAKPAPAPAITVATAPITASPISVDTPTAPAFNPDAPATGGAIRYSPTRPGTPAASAVEAQPVADVVPATSYTVGRGDSLWTIAKKNHISASDLAAANNLRTTATLHLGQKLLIPAKGGAALAASSAADTPAAAPAAAPAAKAPSSSEEGSTYTVRNGETLGAIARKLHVSVGKIAAANNITDPKMIRPGQTLVIPSKGEAPKSKTGASRPTSATSSPQSAASGPVAAAPADQDLDAGLKPATPNEVPVIKVDETSPIQSK